MAVATDPYIGVFTKYGQRIQYGEVINPINPRDAFMHHWSGSPLTQVMAWCLLGAKPWLEPIFIYNQLHP